MTALLLLLLLSSSTLVAADSFPDTSSALRTWFANYTAQHALLDVWNSEDHLLAAALHAFRVSDSREVSPRCLKDLEFVSNTESMETNAMADSSAKFPEGILTAWWTHFGNWAECVNVRNVQSTEGVFHGQMCMVKFYAEVDSKSREEVEIRAGDASMLSALALSMAQCVPSTCTAEDVTSLLKEQLKDLPAVGGVRLAAMADPLDCTTKTRPSLDAGDWVAVGLLAALGALLAASTAYDLLAPAPPQRRPLLAAFSVLANGRKLLAMPTGKGDQTLSCLHGIRFLSMFWVVMGHRYMNTGLTPVMNLLSATSVITSWYRIPLTNATISVDTFFVLSGLLVGYLFFKQPPHKQRLNIPLYYVHRYIRLTPALAMVVLFSATLLYHSGWGPVWHSSIIARRDACRENWWNTLLYVGTFVNPNTQCVGQSWYLMTDMQLHWLSPIFIIPLAKKPKFGMILLAVFCGMGLVENFVLSYVADLGANTMAIRDTEKREFFANHFYNPFYTRFVPYLEGLALGYILGTQKYRKAKQPKLGLVFGGLAWLTVAALLLVPLFAGYDFVQTPPPAKLPTAFYNSLYRATWGLGIVGLVYLCATRNGGPVNSLLSWWGFQLLGRFSYSIYLVHMSLQDIQRSSVKTISYFSDSIILSKLGGDILISLFLGGILSIVCESPFIVIEKELLGGHAKVSNNQRTQNAAPVTSSSLAVTDGDKNTKRDD